MSEKAPRTLADYLDQPYSADEISQDAERRAGMDVFGETRTLIDEYVNREREYIENKREDQQTLYMNKFVSPRVDEMLSVLDSEEVKSGQRSVAEEVDERLWSLEEKRKAITEELGALQGARFVEPEWDAAADRPKGVGYWEPGEAIPKEIQLQLHDLKNKSSALVGLRNVVTEVQSIKEGISKWNLPGDIDDHEGARRALIGELGVYR